MNDFLLVVGISALAAVLTFLGAPLAERFDVPNRIVSGALQFASGIITALVAITLMPPAIRNGPYILTVLAFFSGGVLYVLLEYYTKRVQAKRSAGDLHLITEGLYGLTDGLQRISEGLQPCLAGSPGDAPD